MVATTPRFPRSWSLPLHEGPHLRAGGVPRVHRGEAACGLLEVGQGRLALPRRVQQVGQVGVQRGDPVLVAQLAAQRERLLGQGQGLSRLAAVGQQPAADCSAPPLRPPGRAARAPAPGFAAAGPRPSRGRRAARRACPARSAPGRPRPGLRPDGPLPARPRPGRPRPAPRRAGRPAPRGPPRSGPGGPGHRDPAVPGRGPDAPRPAPSRPAGDAPRRACARWQRARPAGRPRPPSRLRPVNGGRGGLELGQRLPVAAQHGEHVTQGHGHLHRRVAQRFGPAQVRVLLGVGVQIAGAPGGPPPPASRLGVPARRAAGAPRWTRPGWSPGPARTGGSARPRPGRAAACAGPGSWSRRRPPAAPRTGSHSGARRDPRPAASR